MRVEFYGIPRTRTRVGACELPEVKTLGEALAHLASQFPAFAADCLDRGQLSPQCIASLDGQRFVRAPDTPLAATDVLLILSADAGG